MLDALRHGLRVEVVADAMAAVDAAGGRRAAVEMRDSGATLITVEATLARP